MYTINNFEPLSTQVSCVYEYDLSDSVWVLKCTGPLN